MSDFWDKKGLNQSIPVQIQQIASQPIELDEEALAQFQEDPNVDIFEEDFDMADVLSDANLRLEQGRLYQMIMNHDIFGETDADPKAIKNVQREMRRFARDRMETMLGMRLEESKQQAIVSSPFNDMEVTVLKLLASKMSKGATEEIEQPHPVIAPPKKEGITAISGATRPKVPTPLNRSPKTSPPVKTQNKAPVKAQPKNEETSSLTKSIDQMTPAELAEHDRKASERSLSKYAKMPSNMVPMPTGAALEALYTVQAAQAVQPGSTVSAMMNLINGR